MFAMLAVVHVRVTAASHPSISAHAVMGEWAGPASALLCKGQRSLIKFVCLCIECRVGVVRTRGPEQLAPPEGDPLMAARGFWIGILFAIAEQCWFAQCASSSMPGRWLLWSFARIHQLCQGARAPSMQRLLVVL